MSEKMLVTQALDERDLLVKKIGDKIAKASFVDTVRPNEEKVYAKRIDRAEYAKEAEASYQQILDLIERFRRFQRQDRSEDRLRNIYSCRSALLKEQAAGHGLLRRRG